MFGRRRHRAPVNVAPPIAVEAALPAVQTSAVQISEEQLFDVVRSRLEDFMGAHGEWTLVRRADSDTDEFFQGMAAFSLARDVTRSILGATAISQQAGTESAVSQSSLTNPAAAVPGTDTVVSEASLVTRPLAEQVTFELNAIALWADPKRHDPSHVSADLVTPPVTVDDSRPVANAS
jgi:hypothetical protein